MFDFGRWFRASKASCPKGRSWNIKYQIWIQILGLLVKWFSLFWFSLQKNCIEIQNIQFQTGQCISLGNITFQSTIRDEKAHFSEQKHHVRPRLALERPHEAACRPWSSPKVASGTEPQGAAFPPWRQRRLPRTKKDPDLNDPGLTFQVLNLSAQTQVTAFNGTDWLCHQECSRHC